MDELVTIAYNGREAKFIFAAGTETSDVHDTIRTEFSMEPRSLSPFVLRTANGVVHAVNRFLAAGLYHLILRLPAAAVEHDGASGVESPIDEEFASTELLRSLEESCSSDSGCGRPSSPSPRKSVSCSQSRAPQYSPCTPRSSSYISRRGASLSSSRSRSPRSKNSSSRSRSSSRNRSPSRKHSSSRSRSSSLNRSPRRQSPRSPSPARNADVFQTVTQAACAAVSGSDGALDDFRNTLKSAKNEKIFALETSISTHKAKLLKLKEKIDAAKKGDNKGKARQLKADKKKFKCLVNESKHYLNDDIYLPSWVVEYKLCGSSYQECWPVSAALRTLRASKHSKIEKRTANRSLMCQTVFEKFPRKAFRVSTANNKKLHDGCKLKPTIATEGLYTYFLHHSTQIFLAYHVELYKLFDDVAKLQINPLGMTTTYDKLRSRAIANADIVRKFMTEDRSGPVARLSNAGELAPSLVSNKSIFTPSKNQRTEVEVFPDAFVWCIHILDRTTIFLSLLDQLQAIESPSAQRAASKVRS